MGFIKFLSVIFIFSSILSGQSFANTCKNSDSVETLHEKGNDFYHENREKKAFDCYVIAAEKGDAYSHGVVGWQYETGSGVAQNYDEAFKWRLGGAELGNAYAQAGLAWHYSNGVSVEQDYEEAAKWFLLSAEQGDASAMGNLGFHYQYGHGVEQSNEKAFKWRLRGAELGDAYAQGGLAWHYEKGIAVEKNLEEAFKWRFLGAEQGDAYAQGGLAWHYENGFAVEQNYEEAEKWFLLGAEKGDEFSMTSLAWHYASGDGSIVERNDEKAFEWYLLAAEQGSSYAQGNLGWHYENGVGVEKNLEEAFNWRLLGAKQGDAYAQGGLAWHYVNGEAVEQNNEEAVKWFMLSAEQDDAWSQGNLGWHYSEGLGVSQSDKEAFKWLLKGAEGGDMYSQSQVGYIYENGIGTKIDFVEAYRWFLKAAEQGDEWSEGHLAGLLKKDPGLERKINEKKSNEKENKDELNNEILKKYATANRPVENESQSTNTNYNFEPIEKEALVLSKTYLRTEPNAVSKRLKTADKGSIVYVAAKVEGENYFLVNDLNGVALGYIYGNQISFDVAVKGNESVDIEWGNYYALIIANSNYKNEGFIDLNTPKADANEIESILRNKYKFETQLLLDASEEEILEAIYSYREILKESDNFLIYYAGHGYLDESNNVGYWQPIDAKLNKSWTWISNQTVSDELKAMKAKHILVIADSCYSGTFIYRSVNTQNRPKGEENIRIFYEKKNNKKARLALTSGDYQPVPDSLGGEHSPFAKALIMTLNQNDDVLLSSELYQLIEKQLALESTYQEPLYGAILNSDHREGADFIFSID